LETFSKYKIGDPAIVGNLVFGPRIISNLVDTEPDEINSREFFQIFAGIPLYLSSKLSKPVGASGSSISLGEACDCDPEEVFFVSTPLFQTNFLPDLIQVKVFAPTTDLTPTFWHFAPALAAALEVES
jgi:hypothetical protein